MFRGLFNIPLMERGDTGMVETDESQTTTGRKKKLWTFFFSFR